MTERTSACKIQEDGFCTTHQTANMAECANAEMRPAPEPVHLTLRQQGVMKRALLRSTRPAELK